MGRGRPGHTLTPERRDVIERMLRRRGIVATASILREPQWLVRCVAEAMGARRRANAEPEWLVEEDNHLRENPEKSGATLARELAELCGTARAPRRIRARIAYLLGMPSRELRLELSIPQVATLIGRDRRFVTAEIERRRLPARRSSEDGRRYVVPSVLRTYVDRDLTRVDWTRCDWRELIDLLRGGWGVPDERTERRKRQRERA